MAIKTINPTTEAEIKTYNEMSITEVNEILKKVTAAQKEWQLKDINLRAENLFQIANLLEKNKTRYAELITTEMGKPITAALAEIEKCQWVCNHYAKHGALYLQPRMIDSNIKKSYVTYQALGNIFAIMPWNFPFWQVLRFAAPNVMVGNGCVLSHAPISTGAALEIEALFEIAGFPKNLFRTLIIDNETAKQVIQHELIAGVTLTGSDRAGRLVAKAAGEALKKVVLELGGNDPYIVLADADLSLAAEQIVKSRLNNSGQVCISAKRIIVEKSVKETLVSLIKNKLLTYKMGDPLKPETNIGPLARDDLRKKVHQQVCDSIEKGAKLVCGGEIPSRQGFYYSPTLLLDVAAGMPAFDEEIFGPVISVCEAQDEKDAVFLANQSIYGLSAVIFTKDIEKGEAIARDQLAAGTCYVNGLVSSDPRLPFGGIKSSGFGRELSIEGMHAFANIKTVGVVN